MYSDGGRYPRVVFQQAGQRISSISAVLINRRADLSTSMIFRKNAPTPLSQLITRYGKDRYTA